MENSQKIRWKAKQLLDHLKENPMDYDSWVELDSLVNAGFYASINIRELIKSSLYTCKWEFYHYKPPDPRRVGLDLPCKAEIFHKAVEKYKIRTISGGNRSSKTTTMCADVAMACLGSRRYTDYWYNKKKIKARIVAPDFTNSISKSIFPTIEKLLPEKSYKIIKNQLGQVSRLDFANGSFLEFFSYDQKVLKHASVERDLIAFDEPPPKNIYDENEARTIDNMGKIILAFTPIKQDGGYPIGWIYDNIYEKAESGHKEYFWIELDIDDNRKSMGGYLPDEAVDIQIENWNKDEETLQARKSGKFTHLLGLVFKQFDRSIHVIDEFDVKNPREFTRFNAIDPHPRQPISGLYWAVSRKGDHYIYDELAIQDTIKKYCETAKEHEKRYGDIILRFIDESSDVDNQMTKTNVFKEFKYNDLSCRKASNRAMYSIGIDKMKEFLHPEKTNFSQTPMPRLFIFKRCVEFIYQLSHYVWQETVSARARENTNPKEKPRKKNDHLVNCALYVASNNPVYIDYVMEEAQAIHDPFFKITGY